MQETLARMEAVMDDDMTESGSILTAWVGTTCFQEILPVTT